jgi:hypothetical protein
VFELSTVVVSVLDGWYALEPAAVAGVAVARSGTDERAAGVGRDRAL